MILLRITAPHFVAGVVIEDGRVVRAAPIVKYMMAWQTWKVRRYVERKGWAAESVEDE